MTTIDIQIAATTDDGYKDGTAITTGDWQLISGDVSSVIHEWWTRFPGVTIPQSVTITASYLSFYGTGSYGTRAAIHYGINAADPTAPGTAAVYDALTLSTAHVHETTGFGSGAWTNTASFNEIIQELVNARAYNNQAMMFVLKNNGSSTNGYFSVRDYNYTDHSLAAKLHIEYTSGWSKKLYGVTPIKVYGIAVGSIAKINGV